MSELTAALATIEKLREITGCPAGVDLQDHLRKLVAERDASLNAERIWEKTMMEVCGEDGPASVASEIRALRGLRDTAMQALNAQVEQQVADNEKAMDSLRQADAAVKLAHEKYSAIAAENVYLLNGAARELNTSWMFHKTMLGAQAALTCLSLGRESAARDWLEGTTDEACAEIPDDITVAGLQTWFDRQMVSNDGKSGFLTRAEAEEAIRKACPATDRIVAGIKADGVEWLEGEPTEFGRYWVRYETDTGPQYCSAKWMEYNFCASSDTNIHKIWLADHSRSINSLKGVTHYTKLPAALEGGAL